MNIQDMLASTGGFGAIARELGISEAQAAQGAQALLPAILGGMKRQANAQPSGMDALGGLLGQLGGGGLLDNLLGAGGLGAMLDLDGDGNPFDDILGMVRKSMR
jgi:hypothetical protein